MWLSSGWTSSVNSDLLDVKQLRQAHYGYQIDFGIVEVCFDVHAVALDRNDVVNECSHGHVVNGCYKLLTIVDHAHYLPSCVAVARNASVNRTLTIRLLS